MRNEYGEYTDYREHEEFMKNPILSKIVNKTTETSGNNSYDNPKLTARGEINLFYDLEE